MSQVKILETIINKVIAEELSDIISEKDGESTFITPDGTKRTLTSNQKRKLSTMEPGSSVSYQKAGSTNESQKEGVDQTDKELPRTTKISDTISKIVEVLKKMSESSKDQKYVKHSEKVMRHMEAAKSYLSELETHQKAIEDKKNELNEKSANKKLGSIQKKLSRYIKDEAAVSKIMKKMPVAKLLELQNASEKELDEERIAKAMLNLSLNEAKKPTNKISGFGFKSPDAVDDKKKIETEVIEKYITDQEKHWDNASKQELVSWILSNEIKYLTKKERDDKPPLEKRKLIRKRMNDEDIYLKGDEFKLSPEERLKLVTKREKGDDEEDDDVPTEDSLDNPYNKAVKSIEGENHRLAKKPVSSWDDKDEKEYNDILSKQQDEKLASINNFNATLENIAKEVGADISLSRKPFYEWTKEDKALYNRILNSYNDKVTNIIQRTQPYKFERQYKSLISLTPQEVRDLQTKNIKQVISTEDVIAIGSSANPETDSDPKVKEAVSKLQKYIKSQYMNLELRSMAIDKRLSTSPKEFEGIKSTDPFVERKVKSDYNSVNKELSAFEQLLLNPFNVKKIGDPEEKELERVPYSSKKDPYRTGGSTMGMIEASISDEDKKKSVEKFILYAKKVNKEIADIEIEDQSRLFGVIDHINYLITVLKYAQDYQKEMMKQTKDTEKGKELQSSDDPLKIQVIKKTLNDFVNKAEEKYKGRGYSLSKYVQSNIKNIIDSVSKKGYNIRSQITKLKDAESRLERAKEKEKSGPEFSYTAQAKLKSSPKK